MQVQVRAQLRRRGRVGRAPHRAPREVQSHHRAPTGCAEVEAVLGCESVQPRAQPVTECVQARAFLVGIDPRQPGEAGGHRQHRVVERPGVRERIRTRRIEARHQLGSAPERAEREPAADILAQRRQVGPDSEGLLQATAREPRGHHLVEDEQDVSRRRRLAERVQKLRLARDHAARPLHRLDDDRCELVRVLGDLSRRGLRVVVSADEVREGGVERRIAVLEKEDAAVVGALEHHYRRLPAGDAGEREREQVRLRPGVAEADELDRREALANRRREPSLVDVGRPEHDPVRERSADRLHDRRVRMPVQPRRVLAEEVEVLVPVRIDDTRTVAAHDRERERIDVNDGARVPARHELRPLLVQPAGLRIALDVVAQRLGYLPAEVEDGAHAPILRPALLIGLDHGRSS